MMLICLFRIILEVQVNLKLIDFNCELQKMADKEHNRELEEEFEGIDGQEIEQSNHGDAMVPPGKGETRGPT